MSRKLPGTILDPNTSISISSIAVNGATIQTDANSGAITFIPKPTVATPNPVAVVVSPTGGITSIATTGGVANASAVTEAATSNTAAPVTIDIITTAPSNGQALIWNSATSKFIPGSVAAGGGGGGDSTSPKVKSLIYPSNDTAANTVGGQTLYITGSGFAANAQVLVNSAAVPSQSFISASNISFTTPALLTGTYPVYVINPEDGATAILYPGLLVSGEPTWETSAGSLSALQDELNAWSYSLSATGDTPITYALAGGSSLPTGVSLAANGLISGSITSPSGNATTYTFSVIATDAQNQDSTRQFTVTTTTGEGVLFANNVLLIHADGTNNQNNHHFLDSSNNNFTITRNGNATQGTFSPFSQTGWSAFFDGTGDYLTYNAGSTLSSIGSGPLTIEAWVYYTGNHSGFHDIFITSSSMGMLLDAGKLRFYGFSATAAATNLVQNTWVHVAVVRQSSNVFGFIGGTKVLDTTTNISFAGSTGYIGSWTSGTTENWPGYISNLRVSNSARYTANFTPSTTQFTSDANTALLTLQSNRFKDNSNNNFTITRNGDVSIQAWSPFAPTAAYSTANVGGSGYFDGNGDYIRTSGNVLSGAGNATIECWVYPETSSVVGIFDGGPTQANILRNYPGNTIAKQGDGGSATFSLTPNTWSHFAVTFSSGIIKVYVNGVNNANGTYSGEYSVGTNFDIGGINGTGDGAFKGYISNFRVTKSIVYSSDFTPTTSPLTNIANTSLLCNFTNAGIFDQTAKNILETVGDAKVSTAQYKYGTGSIALDGTGDYLSIAASKNFAFGTGDFTIEFWMRSTDGNGNIIGLVTNAAGNWNLVLASSLMYWQSQYATTNLLNRSATAILDGAWHHVAFTRASGSNRMFFDGVLQGAAVSDSTNYTAPNAMQVGSSGVYGDLAAHIDDLRITKGYARYTSNFTPPSSAFKDK